MSIRKTAIASTLLALASAFLMTTSALAEQITATLKASPESYSGKCPATIRFEGKITVTGVTRPVKVQYKFIRSDGALAPVETLVFERDGSKKVSTTWTLGGPGLPTYSGWEAIRIVYPQELDSDHAEFSVNCGEQPAVTPPMGMKPPKEEFKPGHMVKEDCVSFNPATTAVSLIQGDWKIVDGSHWMFSFGNNKTEANQALSVIKYYKMDQSCFVGRPDPSFTYMLVSGNSPAGAMSGEDCVSFNPATADVALIQGDWKIVDGSHWMFSFGNKESEARNALAIIKKYGFTQSCFVGRPGPSFTYLRK